MMRQIRHGLAHEGRFLFSAATLAMFLWGLWPLVEGHMFPVTSKIHINTPVVGQDYMDFTYSYNKLRGKCVLAGVEATINGDYVGFYSTKPGEKLVKPEGPNVSQVWRLWSPTLQGIGIVFIHRCPFEPWSVRTSVYP